MAVSGSDGGQQLALPVNLEVEASFANYYLPETSSNLQAMRCLYSMANGHGESVALVWGEEDVGLSHLLHACVRQAKHANLSAAYVILTEQADEPTLSSPALVELDLLCIDDVHHIAHQAAKERTLFTLFNRLRERGGRLIFASHRAPQALRIQLPDLNSRVLSGPVYQLQPLDDDAKVRAVQLQAHQLGMQISADVAHYIVNRSPRGLGSLFAVLKQLDQATLESKRRLTIPFIKQTLGL